MVSWSRPGNPRLWPSVAMAESRSLNWPMSGRGPTSPTSISSPPGTEFQSKQTWIPWIGEMSTFRYYTTDQACIWQKLWYHTSNIFIDSFPDWIIFNADYARKVNEKRTMYANEAVIFSRLLDRHVITVPPMSPCFQIECFHENPPQF